MAIIDNFEDLHEVAGVDEVREKKATEFSTAPTAHYNAQCTKVTRIEGNEGSWDEGREYARLSFPLVVVGEEEGTVRTLGYGNVNVSWKQYINEGTGKVEAMSNLYAQLTKALREIGAIDLSASVADVFEAVMEAPVRLSVTRNYRTPEGWRTIGANTSPAREAEYIKAGYDCRNFVNRIMTYSEEE